MTPARETSQAIQTLVEFGRLLADAEVPSDLLARLADAASTRLQVAAVAIVGVEAGDRARVLLVRGLPEALVGLSSATDEIQLGILSALIDASAERMSFVRTYPHPHPGHAPERAAGRPRSWAGGLARSPQVATPPASGGARTRSC